MQKKIIKLLFLQGFEWHSKCISLTLALNKGVALATGDIVCFLHSDDLYASNDIIKKVVCVVRFIRDFERAMRIELTSPAWEAGVIAIIRRPQICSFVDGNLSCNMHKSKV